MAFVVYLILLTTMSMERHNQKVISLLKKTPVVLVSVVYSWTWVCDDLFSIQGKRCGIVKVL